VYEYRANIASCPTWRPRSLCMTNNKCRHRQIQHPAFPSKHVLSRPLNTAPSTVYFLPSLHLTFGYCVSTSSIFNNCPFRLSCLHQQFLCQPCTILTPHSANPSPSGNFHHMSWKPALEHYPKPSTRALMLMSCLHSSHLSHVCLRNGAFAHCRRYYSNRQVE
jgi:hypothetical protein